MSGNMHRWKSNNLLEGGYDSQNFVHETASQFSTYSDVSNDDRMRPPDIGQRLRTLFKEGLYTDVKFVISHGGTKPKPSLLAHKAILAIGSCKFREMLYESSGQSSTCEIQINNIPFEAFRNVVEYLYTDDVMFENDESVLETLSAAMKFQVQPLVDKCESYIESVELTEENVCSKFQLASDKKLASLKARCTEFIQENTGSVMRSKNFLAANSSTVRSIFKLEKLNLQSEIELLKGVIQWAAARQDGNTSQRTLIEPFLKHIRLMNVSGQDFNQFVQRYHNIFSTLEATSIMYSLANPSNPAPGLPSWCKRGNNRCIFQNRSAPRERERPRGRFNPQQKLFIGLKPICSKAHLSEMTCILQMNCLRDRFQIEGLKLSFADPVNEMSVIGDLLIDVFVMRNVRKFRLQERLQIENTKEVEYMFQKRVYCNKGETVYFRVEAKDVKNYKFMQFDDVQSSCPEDFPFDWSLCCEPKEYKLYFISEVYFRNGPPPSTISVRRIGPVRNPRR